MSTQLAVQMFTTRDLTKTAAGFQDTLEKIAKIGYPAVQLSAVACMNGDDPEVDVGTAKKLLDDNGLKCIATHRPWDRLRDHTDEEIDFHKTLDCDYTAIGGLPKELHEQGAKGYRAFIAEATPILKKLKDAGIRFGYHNHDKEFINTGEKKRQTCYDLFIDEADPELWTLELDVYWAEHAGVNAERLFERLPGRVPVIHLKDKEVILDEGPVISAIGEGVLDWEHIIPACRKAGVEWYAVEQDVCRRDPIDCLQSSYDYLREMGV